MNSGIEVVCLKEIPWKVTAETIWAYKALLKILSISLYLPIFYYMVYFSKDPIQVNVSYYSLSTLAFCIFSTILKRKYWTYLRNRIINAGIWEIDLK